MINQKWRKPTHVFFSLLGMNLLSVGTCDVITNATFKYSSGINTNLVQLYAQHPLSGALIVREFHTRYNNHFEVADLFFKWFLRAICVFKRAQTVIVKASGKTYIKNCCVGLLRNMCRTSKSNSYSTQDSLFRALSPACSSAEEERQIGISTSWRMCEHPYIYNWWKSRKGKREHTQEGTEEIGRAKIKCFPCHTMAMHHIVPIVYQYCIIAQYCTCMSTFKTLQTLSLPLKNNSIYCLREMFTIHST